MVGMTDGWMDSAQGEEGDLTLGDISIDGDRATAELISEGEIAPVEYVFTKEDGVWKHDQLALLEWLARMLNEAMTERSARGGMSEDEIVRMILGMKAGRPVGPEIWDRPIVKRRGASFPRRRESSAGPPDWVPACAGTTKAIQGD
jgi:hypothetical protein